MLSPLDFLSDLTNPLHEEGHGQPGKHRVGNGVTDERHPAQNDVRTDDPGDYRAPVSYTHLTLPTKRIV